MTFRYTDPDASRACDHARAIADARPRAKHPSYPPVQMATTPRTERTIMNRAAPNEADREPTKEH
jgi:hypothetical protein